MRVDTQTILTIHNNVITRNPRISLKRPASNVWILQLQRVQENDRGWYMCQINTDPMRHRSGYFEVVVPPKIISKDDNSNMVVREGESLTLSCNATGHPKPHIVWRRENGEDIILSSGKKGTILLQPPVHIWDCYEMSSGSMLMFVTHYYAVAHVENTQLTVNKISRLHMGDYLCVASNGIPPPTSKKYRIHVNCKCY